MRNVIFILFILVVAIAGAEKRSKNIKHVVILADASASVSAGSSGGNTENPDTIRRALKHAFSSYFPRNDPELKVALFECATHARLVADWTHASDINTVFSAIDRMSFNYTYEESFTNWEACLKAVLTKSKKENGDIPGYVYLITDGNPTTFNGLEGPPPSEDVEKNVNSAIYVSEQIQKAGSTVLPIGIGPHVSDKYLARIAGPCRWGCRRGWNYMHIDSYSMLRRNIKISVNSRRDPASLMKNRYPRILSVADDKDEWLAVTPDGKVFMHGSGVMPIIKDVSGVMIEEGIDLMDLLPGVNGVGGNIFRNTLDGARKDGWRLKGASGRTVVVNYRPLLSEYSKKNLDGDEIMFGGFIELKYDDNPVVHDFRKRQALGSGLCTADLIADPTCSSSDFNLVFSDAVLVNSTNNTCMIGEMVKVNLTMVLSPTANMRFDIGIQIALDGGDAITGTCANTGLFNASINNTDLDLLGGFGPFYNGEVSEEGDVCGDADKMLGDIKVVISDIEVLCNMNVNGNMTIGTAVSWSKTPQTSENPCVGPDNTGPQTKSSCRTHILEIVGVVPVPPNTTVDTTTTTVDNTTTTTEDTTTATVDNTTMTEDTTTTAPDNTTMTTEDTTTTAPDNTTTTVDNTTTTIGDTTTTAPDNTTATEDTITTAPDDTTTEDTTTVGGNGMTTPPGGVIICTGHVWFDVDGDGIQNGEPDFESITIKLTDSAATMFIAATNIGGNFQIPNIEPGPASLLTEIPPGFVITTGPNPKNFVVPNPGEDCIIEPVGLFAPYGTNVTTPSTETPAPKLSTGEIVGVVIALLIFAILFAFLCVGLFRSRPRRVYMTNSATIVDLRQDQGTVKINEAIARERKGGAMLRKRVQIRQRVDSNDNMSNEKRKCK
ncbi:VWA domain-containing protein [Candidatus Babeliales bacterium]|nr:VWA domain-containing protein [Candidatus Babeliales bacterium]